MTQLIITIIILFIAQLVLIGLVIMMLKELSTLKTNIDFIHKNQAYVKDSAKFIEDNFIKLNTVYSFVERVKNLLLDVKDTNKSILTCIRSYDRNRLDDHVRITSKLNHILTTIIDLRGKPESEAGECSECGSQMRTLVRKAFKGLSTDE